MIARLSGLPVLAAVAVVSGCAAPAHTDGTRTVARWEMSEAAGSRIMQDSSGNDVVGEIGPDVNLGVSAEGSVGYEWPSADPPGAPAAPGRLVTVNDDRLNPGVGDFAITLRFRTDHPAANLIQKGQSATDGGFWKVETRHGKVSCVFRGRASDGRVLNSVDSGTPRLDDGRWHTIRCLRTEEGLTMTVDGARTRHSPGATGAIDNDGPMSIGGKLRCDQVKVDCDYFSGAIDYVQVESG